MESYYTAQRKQLFSFLVDNPDKQFSVKQIAENLQDSSISLSAIYRNLTALEGAGLINRSIKGGSREIYYQYIHSEACKNCIHLTCTKCGRTFHMNSAAADRMLDSVSKEDSFKINKSKTVLYGICRNCT